MNEARRGMIHGVGKVIQGCTETLENFVDSERGSMMASKYQKEIDALDAAVDHLKQAWKKLLHEVI